MTEVGYDEDEIDTMWDEIKAKTKDEETDMQGPRKDPKRYPCDLKDDYVDRQNIRGARRSNVEKTKKKERKLSGSGHPGHIVKWNGQFQ